MPLLFAIVLVGHGLLHLLGFAKAFGLADLSQLTRPVSPVSGILWLVACLLFIGTAASLFVLPRWWWAIGACAVVVSTLAIIPSWADAKFGMVLNVVASLGVIFGFLAEGPTSLRAAYEREVSSGLSRYQAERSITTADLLHLPSPVRRYLEGIGVVGQPRVRNFRARMHGRIRNGPSSAWMPLTIEQFTFLDQPTRLFYLDASMLMIPVQGFHRYVGSSASMLVKAAALVPVARSSGDDMTQAETVTMLNDMCFLAPGSLIDPAIVWETVDDRTARARYTNAGHTVQADLAFNQAGELIDFRSDDRYQVPADGGSPKRVPWSTPIGDYRAFGPVRLASRGEARWHEPEGEYAYIELTIDDVSYNLRSR